MSTVWYEPHEINAFLEAFRGQAIAKIRLQMAQLMLFLLEALQSGSPRLTGAFADSWQPYVGDPPTGDFTGPATAVDVVRLMQSWVPGMPLGISTTKPYARRLAFHGWSKQVRDEWLKMAKVEARARLELLVA